MAQKPTIPKGTRDFTPDEMVKREYIFDTIKAVFKRYGYQPIETPAMENLSTLLGKYGEEGDKLLFRILNSGDFAERIPADLLESPNSTEIASIISEKGLRYDLTVPFARFVVQHRNEITFPFKRYQVQPVWRADRPQKGRYREFYQCDVDVIGSDSLLNEVELVQIIDEVFNRLGVNHTIKLNNRKVLFGLAEALGATDLFMSITIAIDKLDKIGIDSVKAELSGAGLGNDAILFLEEILTFRGGTADKIRFLEKKLEGSETGLKGLQEMQIVFEHVANLGLDAFVEFDLTLARGLNYYTGAIFEVAASDVRIGSICGGGRYDDLTGIFGLPGVSGVGVSFGADRIFDVMNEMGLFPEDAASTTQVFLVNFGEKEQKYCMKLVARLRAAGINAELYPEPAKMKKQMTYANNKNVPFVVLIGENEMSSGVITVKDMASGEQTTYTSADEFIQHLND